MSAPVLDRSTLADAWRDQKGAAITLALGVLALSVLFHQEVSAAVETWNASTAYNHCFLVIPIAAYLAWDRRHALRGMVPQPMPPAALAAIPIAVVWLLAERLGIMEGRQLAAMTFLEVLTFAVLGWRLWWALSGPLLYLYFLVPFGEFLTPRLQDVTTVFVRHGLDLLNIPAFITGYTIEIPEGTFYIAEACAGLRFLIASIAFGVLYSLLMYRSPLRRAAFMVASIIVPIIANGMRAIGIVALGHILGSAQAAATDHVLYGWIFFSLVILLLIVLGLPFRQDVPEAARPATLRPIFPDGDQNWRAAALAGVLAVAIAAVSPAVALQLNRFAPGTAPLQALDLGPACSELPVGPGDVTDAPGRVTTRRVACQGTVFVIHIDVLGTHSTAAPVMAAARRFSTLPNPTHDDEFTTETDWLPVPSGSPRLWRLTRSTRPGPMAAVAIWVDGRPATGGMATRAHLAWTSLSGASVPPVVIGVAPDLHQPWVSPETARALQQRMTAMLAQADVNAQIGRIAASP